MISHKHIKSTSTNAIQKKTPRTQSRVASLRGQEQVDEAAAQVMMALLGSVTPDSR
jgi:hypothetical protein